jgi:TonB family protein
MTMMILEPPKKSRMNMGVGLQTSLRAALGPEPAWKKSIGTKPIPARLALLPDGQSRAKRVGISAVVQIAAVAFLLLIPLIFPQSMSTTLKFLSSEVMTPITMVPVAPPPPPPKIVKVETPPPRPVVEPVLSPKQPHIFVPPKLVQPQPKVRTVENRAPDMTPVFETAKIDNPTNQPKRPRDEVKVGAMSSGNATPATVRAPVEKVQTGGFGDPTGLPGKGNPNGHLIVNAQGLNTLPTGPGYGNGTGGDKGIRGTVASTGFGNGTAVPPSGGGGGRGGSVQTGGFADQSVTAAEAPKKKANDGPADTAVVVQDKPRPEYTAEGRTLKLEGDVVLDVVFLASGHVQVIRVISGLGHGLDESASRAAQQIKFKPALREGQAVDYPARVRIEFRLAY